MAFEDYFDQKVALNDLTGNVIANANAQVYAKSDTTFSTPLEITDLTGLPLTQLRSSPTGVYPAFRVPSGATQVNARSGTVVTPLTSVFGHLLAVLPNPDGQPDQRTIVTQGGQYVLAPAATTPIPDATLGTDGQTLMIVSGAWTIRSPTGGGTVGGILDGGAP